MSYKTLSFLLLSAIIILAMGCGEDEAPVQLTTEKILTIEIDRQSIDSENTKEALLLARNDGEVVFIKEVVEAEIVDYEILAAEDEKFNLFLVQVTTQSPIDNHHVFIKSFLDINLDDDEYWSFTSRDVMLPEGAPQELNFSIVGGNTSIQYLNLIQARSLRPYALENPTAAQISNLVTYVYLPSEKVVFQLKEQNSDVWKGYIYEYEEEGETDIALDLNDFAPLTVATIDVDSDAEVSAQIVGLTAESFNEWWREDNWMIKDNLADQMMDANQYLSMDYGMDQYYTEITLIRGNEVHRLNHFGNEVPASFFTAPINLNYQGDDLTRLEVNSSSESTYFKTNWTYADYSLEPKGVEISWAIEGNMNKAYVMPEIKECLSMLLSEDISTSDFSIRSLGEEAINTFYTGQGSYQGIFKNDVNLFPYSQWLENEGRVYRGYRY